MFPSAAASTSWGASPPITQSFPAGPPAAASWDSVSYGGSTFGTPAFPTAGPFGAPSGSLQTAAWAPSPMFPPGAPAASVVSGAPSPMFPPGAPAASVVSGQGLAGLSLGGTAESQGSLGYPPGSQVRFAAATPIPDSAWYGAYLEQADMQAPLADLPPSRCVGRPLESLA